MKNPKVIILFGSESDKNVMSKSAQLLQKFDIAYEAYAISAHRLPEILEAKIKAFEADEIDIIIAGAGLAAHLPGVIASKTLIPVIGVPLNGALDGMDALLSIVQMPKDVPVATVGIDNAHNAGVLAVQLLAMKYPAIKEKLIAYRQENKNHLSLKIQQNL